MARNKKPEQQNETAKEKKPRTKKEKEEKKENVLSVVPFECLKCGTKQLFNPKKPFCTSCGELLKSKEEIEREKKANSKKQASMRAEIETLSRDTEKR